MDRSAKRNRNKDILAQNDALDHMDVTDVSTENPLSFFKVEDFGEGETATY